MSKGCVLCGKDFRPRNQRQVYCGKRCHAKDRPRVAMVIYAKHQRDPAFIARKRAKGKKSTSCSECGKEFLLYDYTRWPSHVLQEKNRKTCGKACSKERGCRTARECTKKGREVVTKRCLKCNNEFSFTRQKDLSDCPVKGLKKLANGKLRTFGYCKRLSRKGKKEWHYCSTKCRETDFPRRRPKEAEYKRKTQLKRLESDDYIRHLLSSRTTIPKEFWSDDLVQARKAAVRLGRTIKAVQKGKVSVQ